MRKIFIFLILILFLFPYQVKGGIEKWKCDFGFSFFQCNVKLAPECPPEGCGLNELKTLICNLIKFIANCLAQVAFMFGVALGGFQIMAAGGDPGKIESGKKAIIGSVLGLAIVFLAGSLISLILNL